MSDLDLILVPCQTCDGGQIENGKFWSARWRNNRGGIVTASEVARHDSCPDCEGSGWVLVEGAPISLEDLERMAPWADEPVGRPLESGEVELVIKPGSGGYGSTFTPIELTEPIRESPFQWRG